MGRRHRRPLPLGRDLAARVGWPGDGPGMVDLSVPEPHHRVARGRAPPSRL